jgi:hypothetical protein
MAMTSATVDHVGTAEQASWAPGLANADQTLAAVYAGMPRDPASTVAWYVKLLENPKSPLALPGAVDLFGHDCIHILLGRGLSSRDEAFVLGFTMGSSPSLRAWQTALFRCCARRLYRNPYRFSELDDRVYLFARDAARRIGCRPLPGFDYRQAFERPLGELRGALRLDASRLRALYAEELERWPLSVTRSQSAGASQS